MPWSGAMLGEVPSTPEEGANGSVADVMGVAPVVVVPIAGRGRSVI